MPVSTTLRAEVLGATLPPGLLTADLWPYGVTGLREDASRGADAPETDPGEQD